MDNPVNHDNPTNDNIDDTEPAEMEQSDDERQDGSEKLTPKSGSDHYSELRDIPQRYKNYEDTDRRLHRNGDNHDSKNRTSNIVQVLNLSPLINTNDLNTLFGFLGEIDKLELYNFEQGPESNLKVCFVEFVRKSSALMALHLTNTVLIDRALVVLPYSKQHKIPDKETALSEVSGSEYLTNFNHGFMHQGATGPGGLQMVATLDPKLTALGLSQYPQLPMNTDPTRIEEIRRTVYIGNLDSTVPPDQVMKFFNDIGEIKYIRIAGDDTQPTRFAFVEFTHQSSIANALQHNGHTLGSRSLKINHSNNAIVKPQPKAESIEESIKRARDQTLTRGDYRDRHGSSRYDRSRDRDRDRGRDRDRDRDRYYDRRDSPIRSRRSRSRSRDDSPRRRSKSRSRRRSPIREKSSRSRRSRSRESRRKRSRSRSSDRNRSSRHHKSSRR